jgi:GLPGLI family protein
MSIKKIILSITLFVALTACKVQGQQKDTISCVHYKLLVPDKNPNAIENEESEHTEQMRQAHDRVECELYYSKTKSLFKPVEKMEINKDFGYLVISSFVSDLHYKDLSTKKKVFTTDALGEVLNVNFPNDFYKWEITQESKDISGYKCYKAYGKWESKNSRGQQMSPTAIAWFTPQIPVSFGPFGMDGLPGLVLEADSGAEDLHFVATKITFDDKRKINLNPPTGKYIEYKEYDDRLNKQVELQH